MAKYTKPEINSVCFESEDIMSLSSTPYESTKTVEGTTLEVVNPADTTAAVPAVNPFQ